MPEMIYRFIEQNVRPGPHISLKCSARGSPPPQVSMQKCFIHMYPYINDEIHKKSYSFIKN